MKYNEETNEDKLNDAVYRNVPLYDVYGNKHVVALVDDVYYALTHNSEGKLESLALDMSKPFLLFYENTELPKVRYLEAEELAKLDKAYYVSMVGVIELNKEEIAKHLKLTYFFSQQYYRTREEAESMFAFLDYYNLLLLKTDAVVFTN